MERAQRNPSYMLLDEVADDLGIAKLVN